MDKLEYNNIAKSLENRNSQDNDFSKYPRLQSPKECICTVTENLMDNPEHQVQYRTGWIGGDYPVGHPDFGKAVACACILAEKEGTLISLLYEQSGLSRMENIPTLDKFDYSSNTTLKQAYDSVSAWAFSNVHQKWLLLQGDYGLGKTHLSKAVTVGLLHNQIPCRYINANEFIETCKEKMDIGDYDHYVKSVKESPRLVIDDIGQEYSTDWTKQVFYNLIDYRYSNYLPTMITTNKDRPELVLGLGGAIVDRIFDVNICKQVQVKGTSVRMKGLD